jgi:hypothetical protein
VTLGWSSRFSHYLKGSIRRTLILGQQSVPIRFKRLLQIRDDGITLTDELRLESDDQLSTLAVGDEFFVRYVPQSRYFQSQELEISPVAVPTSLADLLNRNRELKIVQRCNSDNGSIDVMVEKTNEF